MKVILRSDIINVGQQGEIKEVAAGFARNYLIPKKLVMPANAQNMRIWERERVRLEKIREETIIAARELAAKLEACEVSIKVNIGENGKIFGSVTPAGISKAFEENGFDINKRDILLSDNIKETGAYEVSVRLHPQVLAKVKVAVTGGKQ